MHLCVSMCVWERQRKEERVRKRGTERVFGTSWAPKGLLVKRSADVQQAILLLPVCQASGLCAWAAMSHTNILSLSSLFSSLSLYLSLSLVLSPSPSPSPTLLYVSHSVSWQTHQAAALSCSVCHGQARGVLWLVIWRFPLGRPKEQPCLDALVPLQHAQERRHTCTHCFP